MYILSFYDMIDGWIGELKSSDNLDELIAQRDRENAKLNPANIRAGEHYGIIQGHHEIDCQLDKLQRALNRPLP